MAVYAGIYGKEDIAEYEGCGSKNLREKRLRRF